MVHKTQVYDRLLNISELALTHTSESYISESDEEFSDPASSGSSGEVEISEPSLPISKAESFETSTQSFKSRCSHPSIPHIKSNLRLVFT